MSLIALNSGETATNLLTRLQTLGVEIETGCNSATSIAYSANGLILRQKESVRTTEYVGLTKEAAQKLEALDGDATTTTIYYKQIPNANGDYAAVAITTGTKTDYVPSRVDEGDAWKCVKTVTTFAAASGTGWSSSRPSVSSTGIVVSETKSKTYVACDAFGTKYYQNETVVVREYPFLSASEAATKVSENSVGASFTRDIQIPTSWSTTEGIKTWANIQMRGGSGTAAATDKVATRRYDGTERWWTVQVTESTFQITNS